MITPSRSSALPIPQAPQLIIALAGLIAVLVASAGMILMVRRRVCKPIVDLTATMTRLAAATSPTRFRAPSVADEIGAMAAAVRVFKDNMIEAERLSAESRRERRQDAARPGARRIDPRASKPRSPNSSAGCPRPHRDGGSLRSRCPRLRSHQPSRPVSSQLPPNRPRPTSRPCQRTEELTSSISEIGRQVPLSPRDRGPRRRQCTPYGDTARSLAEKGAAEDRRRRELIQSIAAQTTCWRSTPPSRPARRRCRPRLCGGRLRGQIAGRPTAKRPPKSPNRSAIQAASDETVTAIQNVANVIAEIDQIGIAMRPPSGTGFGDAGDFPQRPEACARTQEVNANISGVQRAPDETGSAAPRCWARASNCRRSQGPAAGQPLLSEVRAA